MDTVTKIINDCIERDGKGSCRDALNVVLARLHKANNKIERLEAENEKLLLENEQLEYANAAMKSVIRMEAEDG